MLDEAGKEAGENYCHYMDTQEAKERQAFTGIQHIQLSKAEVARWKVLLDATKRDWESAGTTAAKRAPKRSRPGTQK